MKTSYLIFLTPAGILDYLKDPQGLLLYLLDTFGPWILAIVALMVLVESGILFPLLPGDSMIFALGLLHIQMHLSLWTICIVLVIAATLGAQIGYALGVFFGAKLFKPDARVLKTSHLVAAHDFFAKYGGRAMILARFVPFARTFVPLAAGMSRYSYKTFTIWNFVGGVIWTVGLVIIGAQLGNFSFIRDNVELIALLVVFISIVPILVKLIHHRLKKSTASTDSTEI